MPALVGLVWTFAKSLGLKFWLYVVLALAVVASYGYVYHKGNVNGQDKIKAQDEAAYQKQRSLDLAEQAKEQADAKIKESEAEKKLADLQKQSDNDANTIKALAAKAKKAAQSSAQPSSDPDNVCRLSDDELRNYQKLIDKANGS